MMLLPLPLAFLLSALLIPPVAAVSSPAKRYYDTHDYYVLEHSPLPSSSLSLDQISQILGVQVVEQAGELLNHWLVRVEKRNLGFLGPREEERDLVLDTYNELRVRAKDTVDRRSLDSKDIQAQLFSSSVKSLTHQIPRQRTKRAPIPQDSPARATAERLGIEDPLFPDQWHLINDEFPQHMMNVTGVWEAMGLTGKGVISSLVDDGLDYDSEDLKANFDAEDSYDFNDHEPLPTPKLSADHHGTRCAGQIAAGKNTVCGLGIAYDSRVAGVRILSGPISDVDEAAALNYGYQNVDIFSCSWGPPDDGRSMEGPSMLIQKAFVNGINQGRGGKGSVFVFASGNGAAHGDQCNFDGYTNSIYSVTVSAVDYKGLHPYYSEPCAANMIVAYSSGSGKHIVTTDKGTSSCATSHGGTSAAAPNAVGVIALALEANPSLTWRDIQYICILTANQINPDDPDWEETKGRILGIDVEPTISGKPYSYKYGFGVMDGYRFVQAAKEWKNVKPQAWFRTHSVQLGNGTYDEKRNYTGGFKIPQDPEKAETQGGSRAHLGEEGGSIADTSSYAVVSTISVNSSQLSSVNFDSSSLEHIQVRVWIQHGRRGDVEVEITSPQGVKSVLGAKREQDADDTGYGGWVFMSIKHWGENPVGTWTIRVSDQSNPNFTGSFLGWNMVFWGAALDDSKPTPKYELPSFENESDEWVFPPPTDRTPSSSDEDVPSTTRIPTRPTEHLPGDHGTAEGENSKPAFGDRPSSTPTADEGYFSDLSKLSSNHKWFGGAIALVALFGICAALFFWRRRRNLKKSMAYESLSDRLNGNGNEDVAMTGILRESGTGGLMSGRGRSAGGPVRTSGGGTRELYDAFGEVSDDDEDDDADEATRLNPNARWGEDTRRSPGEVPRRGGEIGGSEVGFHSGFLDDDDEGASPAGSATNLHSQGHEQGQYRDHL